MSMFDSNLKKMDDNELNNLNDKVSDAYEENIRCFGEYVDDSFPKRLQEISEEIERRARSPARTALGCQKDTRIVKLELFDNADFGAFTWTEVLRLTEKRAQLRTYSRNGTEIKFIDRWVPKASVAMVNGKLEIHATTWQRACGDAPRRETANNRIMQDQKDEDLAKAPRAAEKKYYEEERRKRDDRARATAISKQTSSPIAVLVRGFDDDEVEVRNWSTRQGNATRPVIMKIILKDGKELWDEI